MLAQRLQKVLPKIISLDQQGYIKDRYIGYNIRQIQDIIDYTETLNIDGAILFLDFKKSLRYCRMGLFDKSVSQVWLQT